MAAEKPVTATEAVFKRYHGSIRRDIVPLVPDGTGTLLDIGGGYGGTACYLKSIGKAGKVGVIDRVKAVDADFHYAGDLERGDSVEQALADHGPFDTILALDVLEHLVDPWAMVARLDSALAADGVIVASIPNVRHVSALGPLLFKGRWDYEDRGILDRTHLRFFVRSTAVDLMQSSGLVAEEVRRRYAGSRLGRRLVRYMSFGLAADFVTLQYLIRVRRRQL